MTLLTCVRNAAARIGIPRPEFVTGNNDAQVVQLLALSNEEGKYLANKADFGFQQKIYTFSLVDGINAYDLPTDYDRFISATYWDNTNRWPLIGPVSPQDWQLIISGIIASGPRRRFRVYGTDPPTFHINPDPGPSDTGAVIAYEYCTRHWCRAAGAEPYTTYDEWQADTDLGLISEELMTLGLIWRWNSAKGLPYEEAYNKWEIMRDREIARDAGAPTLSLQARNIWPLLVGPANVQDGNYPST